MLPKVEVLMSTYNGEKYIEEQIQSILEQINVDVHLMIRDDGSSDGTIHKILQFAQKFPEKISFAEGINMGPAKSFMHMVMDANKAEYYAFADQDDIWDLDKLELAVNAIEKIEKQSSGIAILYHSSTAVADSDGKVLSVCGQYNNLIFLQGETRSVTGCTMVFNDTLEALLRIHMPENMIMHDEWVHKVCLAVGGVVVFDPVPHIRYRQHARNVIGGPKGLWTTIKRRLKFLSRLKRKQFSGEYTEILETYRQWMPKQYIERCKTLCEYDKSLKNTAKVLLDKYYFKGRFHWRWTNIMMVLLKRY